MPAKVKIFCYLGSPRVYKSTIAARYCNTEVEYIGAQPKELQDWLWDHDARKLSEQDKDELKSFARHGKVGFSTILYKTDRFLKAHPFGNVPAGFAKNGDIGIFESNSIMRLVARAGDADHKLYGSDMYEQSRIDSFLDQTLVLAVNSQQYFLAGRSETNGLSLATYNLAENALLFYLTGVERSLSSRPSARFIAAPHMTLVDIAFACELSMFASEVRLGPNLKTLGKSPVISNLTKFPHCHRLFNLLIAEENFAIDLSRNHDLIKSLLTA